MMVVKGDVYYSDSDDDDDDDVDRYVFLARNPAPAAGRHAEEDRGASSDENDYGGGGDDDGDASATADEEERERSGGRRGVKRPLIGREILDDAPPPPPPKKKKKKAQVELIAPPPLAQTPPSGSGSETESDSAPSLCGVRAGESGSEGSHGKAHHEHHRAASGREGEAKNATKRKRGLYLNGKRRRGPSCEEDGDRAVAAAAAEKAAASPAATSGLFLCNQCERSFDSFQALGGHVLGHRKKAKIAIAAAACLDADDDSGGAGDCKEEANAVIEANEETSSSIAHAGKMAAVAARRGKANGVGGGDMKKIKTVDDVAEAEHRDEDVDSGEHDDVNGFGNEGNAIAASSGKDFTNGGNSRSNGKRGIGAGIPNQKGALPGTCHEGANGDGNAGRTVTVYKCKVCGTECPTGRALGGHMRKHRKQPPLAVGAGEGRSSQSPPTDDDCQVPLARMFGATGLQKENRIGWV